MKKIRRANPNGSIATIFVGSDCYIASSAHVGEDAHVGDYARVGDDARVGDSAHVGSHAHVGDSARIGDGAKTFQPIYIARLGDDRDGWRVTLTREYLQIGCQMHPTADWWSFDDVTINKMDCAALRWWRKYKPALMAMARANGWTDGMEDE